ncbi:MAG: acyltransferase family protein [Verrucomicrobiota bacterium]|jgi:peptidoglycan/LPS O-acetylase OafA/YrhL
MSIKNDSHLKYRPYVDGLRALAVIAVIFFHAGIGFGGGFVGVDVFFVISGYLITGLILKDLDRDQFHIFAFWERRVRRILPALALVVFSCLLAGWFLFFPQDFKELGQSVLAQAALVSNFFFYANSGYFAEGVDMKPLLHTWSLAVEEQFYLLFPFLLLGLKRFSRKSLVPAILLLCALSFSLSVYCSYAHPRANFYLLPTRAWELAIGAFLAALPEWQTSKRWLSEVLGWSGLLAILYAMFFYTSETRFPGASAILPCVGAALVIWANSRSLTSGGRLLAARPVVFIGLISYSLYLWHWPLLVFFKYWKLSPVPASQRLLLLLLSFIFAVFSWRFVETPFRKRVLLVRRWQIFSFGGASTAGLIIAGLAVFKLQGLPSRIPARALQYLEGDTILKGGVDPAFRRQLGLTDALKGDFIAVGTRDTNLPVSLLIWGDSHAEVELPVLDAVCKEHLVRAVAATHSQTAPLTGYQSQGPWSLNEDSIAFNGAVVGFIRSKHVRDVLIIGRWDYYIEMDKGTDRLRKGVLATISALRNSGARIWIMRQVPKYPWNVPKALASAVLHGRDPEQLGRPLAEQREASKGQDPMFDGLGAMFPGVTVLDPTALFVDGSGRCRVEQNGKPLYFDTDHVNVTGAMGLRPLFEPILGMSKAPTALQANGLGR